jgi:hypothetical protein
MQHEIVGKNSYKKKELICKKHNCVPNNIRLSWCMNQRCQHLVWMCRVEAEVITGGKHE